MTSTGYIKQRSAAIGVPRRVLVGSLSALALFAVGLWNLSAPPSNWDEGWTLSVARNWVERGHYGRLLNGELAPNGLEASFPVTGLVALSFRLFGVGLWQGRLGTVLFMVAALVVLYDLARRLYNRDVAVITLAVLLLTPMFAAVHALTLSRVVFGEMPMLFCLLAGYTSFLLAMRRSLWFMLLAVGLWGIALITKAQVVPFWRVSLVVPLLVMLLGRQWKTAGLLGIALLGSSVIAQQLVWLQRLVLQGRTLPTYPIHGLAELVALVPFKSTRPVTLVVALTAGLPTLLGLCYAAWQWFKNLRSTISSDPRDIVRLALLVLAGSWYGWFALLSIGIPRHLFPVVPIGSLLFAALLYDLRGHFRLSAWRKRYNHTFSYRRLAQLSVSLFVACVLIAVPLLFTAFTVYHNYSVDGSAATVEAARFLNTATPADALIETYDSELHFFLNRRYHYPPDQIHVDLIRRGVIDKNQRIDYDPLAADPDYLVVGSLPRRWRLYEPVLATGAFRLVREYGDYEIYERVR